ncbi:MAG: DUF3472 domain-containing protein [Sphingobacterium sp.]|jgi:hypothetical protein|nr:DUF3472 domain-containing protein [Sphingobacterium sp.]
MIKAILCASLISALIISSCSKSIRSDLKPKEYNTQAKNDKDLPNLSLSGNNAAPSQHLVYVFKKDAVLKMHKIKITNTAKTEYFSVHNYRGGYSGLQDTPDKNTPTAYTLIASLWDLNTAAKNYAFYSYKAPTTVTSRFGGEGDGQKTVNPYGWELNTWYNVVLRSWKENGTIYIANFIQNEATGKWFHTSTIGRQAESGFLGVNNGAFLENWVGDNPLWDGRFHRKAFFKDCWNLGMDNVWEKSTSRYFSANANDAGRNGYFDRAFNAGYDAQENAHFMEHGGSVIPDVAFGTGRTLDLPEQANQGVSPSLTALSSSNESAKYKGNKVIVSWKVSDTGAPQLSFKIELIDPKGAVLANKELIRPEKRADTLNNSLATGNYNVRLTITDIFNQQSTAKTIQVLK